MSFFSISCLGKEMNPGIQRNLLKINQAGFIKVSKEIAKKTLSNQWNRKVAKKRYLTVNKCLLSQDLQVQANLHSLKNS